MDFKINGFQIKHSGLLQFFTTARERNSVASNVKLELVQNMYLMKLLPYLGEGLHILANVMKQEKHITHDPTPCLFESKYSVNTMQPSPGLSARGPQRNRRHSSLSQANAAHAAN